MADLPTYNNLQEKKDFFENGEEDSFIISTRKQLDRWFNDIEDIEKQQNEIDATALIYRGTSEAKYKLLTSAQRVWISNEMQQWTSKKYLEFIDDLVKEANKNTVINKAFDYYNYSNSDREFPILSLLQHYGAPTPLMDWTYNQNVAFFFATDGLTKKSIPKADIDDYFSIYRINKRKYKRELLNIIDFEEKEKYPPIDSFSHFDTEYENIRSNNIFYISDFERKGESRGIVKPYSKLKIRTLKPLTSTYNQNIIPQEGLFIFNPFPNKPLEDIFNVNLNQSGYNLSLSPFACFNIHKDLSEYLRRKIDKRFQINKSFIYPSLTDEARKIKEKSLNNLI
ncbi:hypothetical protein HDF26_001863 [Pedobacter cryoconitis]|uniref:FRG domain-containing protein n=1 Tax=Pedobacter cryoconitis TaxID=188932 RepID=UPI001618296E|nr:FRG domain-containing protein [Pedobacter cryoconitis]MBB6271436.1 hypothetical protein [Pedobacter cryoconitis]